MNGVKIHPLGEIVAKKLSGITVVPKNEQLRMTDRAIKAAMKYHDERIAELEWQNELLRNVADGVFVGGNHLASYMLNSGMSSLNHYQKPEDIPIVAMRDVWIAWKAIMRFSETLAAIDDGALGGG